MLTAALAEAPSGNPFDAEEYGNRVRELVIKSLGGRASGQEGVGLDAVVSAIGRQDLPRLLRSASDPGKLADERLAAFPQPVGAAAGPLVRVHTEQSLRLSDALDASRSQLIDSGEAFDQAAELWLSAQVASAAVRSDRLGGDPVRFLTLDQLLAPFASRRSRNLAGSGIRDDDVAGMFRALAAVQQRIIQTSAEREPPRGQTRSSRCLQSGRKSVPNPTFG